MNPLHGLRLPRKFILAIFGILVVPVAVSGFLMHRQLIGSAVEQERLALFRAAAVARQAAQARLGEVERTASLVATNAKINEFLDSPFRWIYDDYETYSFLVGPAIENLKFQNRTLADLRVYCYEPTIPERFGNGGFYSFSRIGSEPWVAPLLSSLEGGPLWLEGPAPDARRPEPPASRPPFEYWYQVRSLMSGRAIALMRLEASGADLFESLRLACPAGARCFASDPGGRVIYSSREADEGARLASLVSDRRPLGAAAEESGYSARVGGEESVLVSTRLGSLGVELWIASPTRSVLAGTRASLAIVLAVCVAAVAVLLAASNVIVRALLARLEGLVAAMRRVEEGDLSLELEPGAPDEFGELALSFNSMLRRIEGLLAEVVRLERAEKSAEIAALEAQVNPHFLYNALSAITWEARKRGAEGIEELSVSLAKFYRAALSGGRGLVPLAEELETLGSYLAVQRRRAGERLAVSVEAEEAARGLYVPRMVLQPIVENAIVHGLEPKRGGGAIRVTARLASAPLEALVIRVEDDGIGMPPEVLAGINAGAAGSGLPSAAIPAEGGEPGPGLGRGSGLGLRNIRDRITFRFGPDYGLAAESAPGAGTRVTLTLPRLAADPEEGLGDGA